METTSPESSGPSPSQGERSELVGYWRIVVRRRWLILGVFLLVTLCAAAYALRLPKIYTANASLVIETVAPKPLGSGTVQDVAESSGTYWFSKEYYETQYNIMRSHAVAARVAAMVRSDRDDKFLSLDTVPSEEARAAGLKALAALRQHLMAAADPAAPLLGRVQVDPVKDSRITRLLVEDPDPVLAAGLANAFARAFMVHNLASKTLTTEEASESLETQLPELEDKLETSAKEFVDFKKKHDIVWTSWEDKQNIISQRLTRIYEELTTVRVKKAGAKAKNDSIVAMQKEGTNDPIVRSSLVSPQFVLSVQQLRMKAIDVRSECADLEERVLEKHPRLISCHQRLQEADKALHNEIESALTTARMEYADLVATEKNLLAELADIKTEAMTAADYEPEYLRLRRIHEYNVKLYDVALRSLKESGLSGSTRLNNVSPLDAALAPTSPSKPNVRNILMIGALIGLLLGLGLAFGLELLDNTITSQEQVENQLATTFLGILPSIADKGAGRDLVVAEAPKSAVAECCRAIRTNLLFMSPQRPLKSMLITSAGPRDGKTTAAVSLAITMAKGGNRVLLVDADLRRPRVHSAFKVPNGAGLSSLILGQGELEKTVKSSGVEGLSVLTCGPVPPNPAELLHTEAFTNLLDEMKAKFDRVIIDSPPVGAVSDAVVMSTKVDGTVLVLKSGYTSKDAARRTVKALRDVNARLFGAVLNDIDLDDQKGGGYYYYTKYGYYYGDSEAPSKDGSAA